MNRQKLFRQYFTPQAVARAMVELARPYLPPDPIVADLSCGEGALLCAVLERGIARPDRVYGFDIDPAMQAIWEGTEGLQGCHLQIQDGLAFEPRAMGLDGQGIDLLIGNPPFNRAQDRVTDPETLKRFRLGRRPLKPAEEASVQVGQMGFEFREGTVQYVVRVYDHLETVVSQPIEALFVEKSIQVARPGGTVVIILPDGLLSNEGSQDVRDFVVGQTDALAVIGLPRRLFDNDAKTSILLLRKKLQPGLPQHEQVFLASVSKAVRDGNPGELDEVVQRFRAGPTHPGMRPAHSEIELLTQARGVFYVAHSAEAWQTDPPDQWLDTGYRRWVGDDIEPQLGDPLLVYKFPSDVPGAGFCSVLRIAACEHRETHRRGYYVAGEPWLSIEPPMTYQELAENRPVALWAAYRVRFRGWAKGGAVPVQVWAVLRPGLLARSPHGAK